MSKERNCQIRMSSALWNLVGEIAQDLGHKDARGRHSAVMREMIAASAAKWTHSPYICRSSRHTIFVEREGRVFYRCVQILRLNSEREKLPWLLEMKPEKRIDYRTQRKTLAPQVDEHDWFLRHWLFNYFAVWNGKRASDDLELFEQPPLSFQIDDEGGSSKSVDLPVHGLSGRFLTREVLAGLDDYVQWKKPGTSNFDRVDVPIDIPTSDLEIHALVDQEIYRYSGIEPEEIASLALEFRNRESARFQGKEVGLFPEVRFEEQFGRSPDDEGADEVMLKFRRLRQRVNFVLAHLPLEKSRKDSILGTLRSPQRFLFYKLSWPSPHLGISACIRWEKPLPPPQEMPESP